MSAIAEKLENVSVVLKANVYFDGGVISHAVILKDGTKKTIGVIRPGSYHFNTDAPEQMDIITGPCHVRLAGEKEWTTFTSGQTFNVAGKSSFDIRVEAGLTEYLCTFKT